jgi:hypothetical protein
MRVSPNPAFFDQSVFVGLMELIPNIADPFPIIEGAVPLQLSDDPEAQGLDTVAEVGGGKPGVHQEIAGRKALSQGCLEHLQRRRRFAQLLGLLQTSSKSLLVLRGVWGKWRPKFTGKKFRGVNNPRVQIS